VLDLVLLILLCLPLELHCDEVYAGYGVTA
jgi:hypothetical protein